MKTAQRITTLLVTLAALFAGQQAFAARKAVTYTITSIELNSSTNNYDIVFTRSGDAPFDASAPTTYTASVNKLSFGQNGNPGQFHIDLADGFEIHASWNSGSNVTFSNNCIQSGVSEKPITYAVSNPNGGYYVTRIVMQGMEYTWDNTTYDFIRPFAHNTSTVRPFGSLTLTYYDAIPEAIGSIPYNRSLETYEINCAQHLNDLASHVNGGNTCAGLTFKMIADIDFEPATAWDDFTSIEDNFVRIGQNGAPFQGTFDGDGHTISGIRNGNYLSCSNGLFGLVGSGGTIRNVTLANARIIGLQSIGGIVGWNEGGTVENCHAAHNVVIRVISANAGCCGGIVGENTEKLYNLSHGAPPSIVTGCTSAAVISKTDVAGCADFGGIVGKNGEGCTVSNCTAAGVIVPSYGVVDYTGAIVGKNEGTLSGNTYHSSLVGTFAFNIGAGRGYIAGTTLDDTKLFLYDDRDNTALINAYANSSTAYQGTPPTTNYLAVTLKGRTLHKDGTWNTLCLPFTISSTNSLPDKLKTDVSVMALDNSTAFDATTGTLTVIFNAVGPSTEITKGKPYIIKWTSGNDVTDPTFNYVYRTNMTASPATVKSSDNYVSLRGTYGPVTPTDGKLFDTHNADNRGFHCYITLTSPTAHEGDAFGGWYTDNAFTTPVTTLPFGTDGSFSLYAKITTIPASLDIAVTPAALFDETKHVATFYQSTYDYQLPTGALAYTASLNGGKVVFHRIGENSNIIPANSAVIIIADASAVTNGKITLTKLDSSSGVTAHSGNILQGRDTPVTVTNGQIDGKAVYVLGTDSNNAPGFFPFSGTSIPAGKAYYVVE